MAVTFSPNTKKKSASPIRNNRGVPRTKEIIRGPRAGQTRTLTYRNTRTRQPENFYRNPSSTWDYPGLNDIRRRNVQVRRRLGLRLDDEPLEDPPEGPPDPIVVTAEKDSSGRWVNKICNTVTQICFYAAIGAAAAKAKGLWGGTRKKRTRNKV